MSSVEAPGSLEIKENCWPTNYYGLCSNSGFVLKL